MVNRASASALEDSEMHFVVQRIWILKCVSLLGEMEAGSLSGAGREREGE